jgi:hypothetical protein
MEPRVEVDKWLFPLAIPRLSIELKQASAAIFAALT